MQRVYILVNPQLQSIMSHVLAGTAAAAWAEARKRHPSPRLRADGWRVKSIPVERLVFMGEATE